MLKVPSPSPLCGTALLIVRAVGLLQTMQSYVLEGRGLTGMSPRRKIEPN